MEFVPVLAHRRALNNSNRAQSCQALDRFYACINLHKLYSYQCCRGSVGRSTYFVNPEHLVRHPHMLYPVEPTQIEQGQGRLPGDNIAQLQRLECIHASQYQIHGPEGPLG